MAVRNRIFGGDYFYPCSRRESCGVGAAVGPSILLAHRSGPFSRLSFVVTFQAHARLWAKIRGEQLPMMATGPAWGQHANSELERDADTSDNILGVSVGL
jgi:hypothetical protein